MIKTEKYTMKLSERQITAVVEMLRWYIDTRGDWMHISEMACLERAYKLREKLSGKLFTYVDKPRKLSLNLQEAATLVEVLDALHEDQLGPMEVMTRYQIYDAIMQ